MAFAVTCSVRPARGVLVVTDVGGRAALPRQGQPAGRRAALDGSRSALAATALQMATAAVAYPKASGAAAEHRAPRWRRFLAD